MEKDFIAQNVLAVANSFIKKGIRENNPVDHMKVQKLCYLAQGWHLGFTNDMFFGDDVEAWQYGPVIPALFDELTLYGRDSIVNPITFPFDNEAYGYSYGVEEYCESLIDWIWAKYGHLKAFQLSDLTHQRDTPWWKTVKKLGARHTIQPSVIAEYYAKRVKEIT